MEDTCDPKTVKPVLKKHPIHSQGGEGISSVTPHQKLQKKGLVWDEKAIQEHDKLRGTRMKIDEPNTPFHYDSHSDHESGDDHPKSPERGPRKAGGDGGTGPDALNWDHLANKLNGVAAVREAYPSSPSSHGGDGGVDVDSDAEDAKRENMKLLEFEAHRKQHYNEFEVLKRFRDEHLDDDDDGDDESNGDHGDDEMAKKM